MLLFLLLLTAATVWLLTRSFGDRERRYILFLFAVHIACAAGQVWLFQDYYGYGDIDHYIFYGRLISKLLSIDPARWSMDVVRAVFHLENTLPFEEMSHAGSTGTLCAITGVTMVLVGPTMFASCLVVSMFSFSGQLLMYSAARSLVLPSERITVLAATILVPSVVFWSSGVQKEALAVGFLGILCWGLVSVARRHLFAGTAAIVVGALGVGVLKPYILFPLTVATGAWFYASRQRHRAWTTRSVVYAVVAGVTVVGGVYVLGHVFPSFSLEDVGETASHLREAGASTTSAHDATLDIGGASEKSLGGQIPYIPLAILNTLFRPMFWEVRSVIIFAAATEMLAISIFVLMIVFGGRRRLVPSTLASSPLLVFCLAFVITFAAGVGIATTNMGTLSRYRMPMMPFYVTAVLLVYRRSRPLPTTTTFVRPAIR